MLTAGRLTFRERFDWPAASIIDICNEAPKSLEQIRSVLKERTDREALSSAELQESLSQLTAKRILYEERGKYFTLAIPENSHY